MLPSRLLGIVAFSLVTFCSIGAVARVLPFDPSALKPKQASPANDVLVLGTQHISGWPEAIDMKSLQPLVDRLAVWNPGIIAVEHLSGPQCDMMRQYPARYAASVADYCWDSTPANKATGLDVPAATQAADKMLKNWPKEPTAAQRRQLAATFLAAGEQGSALVQWLRLPVAERRVGDGLDQTLVNRLTTLQSRRDEVYQIAAPLAARLGLERLVAMDDHTADSPIDDEKAYGEVIGKLWDNPAVAKRSAEQKELDARLSERGGVMALYRALNAPDQAKLIYDSDFGATLGDTSPQQFGRRYVGYWETRNLRMAANIRDAMALAPGQRTLVIVGAAHKFYLEAYLNQMHDAIIVDSQPILK